MTAPQTPSDIIPAARAFLRDLSQNNSRDWFHDHKAQYDRVIKRPALSLLDALTPLLTDLSGMAVKPKLFRPHRDMRFSEDKTPYHTHMHLLWACPDGRGWFFGLAEDYATAGAGIMVFDPDQLEVYREDVAGEDGAELQEILARIAGRMDPPALKRVPPPHPADHPRADLLRRKGLVVWRDDLESAAPNDPEVALRAAFTELAPLQEWLEGL
ncbi:DUF2461 domain-containing protein [Thalassococcus sp. BH17M4-6]|uniref:DUF2461 domain-containing protein n=1 Tax=Thalassococcus sp. BH17M4-6 TaxID=3413148 RepID=UPI003BDBA23D